VNGAAWAAARSPLRLGDAVAAIILVDGTDYLLQLRDPLPQIWYPDHWGTFGGAVDPGEDEMSALRRELCEELAFELDAAAFFARFDFDLSGPALGRYYRSYWEVRVSRAQAARFVLGEGARMEAFAPDRLFALPKVTPYDAFALFLHHAQDRLRRGAA
jgi:8-oxo-dGTP pyrophosphatase MutT (NUDIX family)